MRQHSFLDDSSPRPAKPSGTAEGGSGAGKATEEVKPGGAGAPAPIEEVAGEPAKAASKPPGAAPARPAKPTGRRGGARKTGARKTGAKKKDSPMMEQFKRAKKEAPDALLFFRMGDFYELFHEDAVTASRELGITLTSRSKGEDAFPMAGVPVKAAENYVMRLVNKGFRVAICEQLTDPRDQKGIVERGIVRVVTPGTLTEEDSLDAKRNNYLAGVYCPPAKGGGARRAGLAWVDISTGRFQIAEVALEDLVDQIGRVQPAELLWPPSTDDAHPELALELRQLLGPRIGERDAWRFDRGTTTRALLGHFGVATLEGYGVDDDSPVVPAAGALIEYLQETQRSACQHIRRIERVEPGAHLVLDRATRSCLELTQTQMGARREGTVLDTIDATLTPMGGRLLREWLLNPLCEVAAIQHRQRGVAELVEGPFLREDVCGILSDVLDMERLVAKIATGRANGRDLVGLAASMAAVPPLREKLGGACSEVLTALREQLDPLEDLTTRIRTTLVDAPPLTLREGGLIRTGFSAELDELHQIAGEGRTWMTRFQATEIERTGIAGLKVGFNSVFGYFLEVPRGQVKLVPEHYVRKQTIKNSERYITPELKEYETKVLKAEERSRDLEYKLFGELRDAVGAEVGRILDTAHALAQVDVLAGLAEKAAQGRYCAPEVNDSGELHVVDGRHPVIELSDACDSFVPNDTRLDGEERNLGILTGPNMAGKSTYIRQTALIVLMAQIGSFVPATEARVGVVDRIFTRVGSGDDISRGASTFMVEMVEIANILNNATSRSLIVLDEVGRGTSTFDGLALAWAIAEHIHETIGARALFATHYHQLTDLADRYRGIFNLSVAVREWDDEIVFLHKIGEGGTDRSYGIHVARLAGVPADMLTRARKILHDLEDSAEDLAPRITGTGAGEGDDTRLYERKSRPPTAVEKMLSELDPNALTPVDALIALQQLKQLADE